MRALGFLRKRPRFSRASGAFGTNIAYLNIRVLYPTSYLLWRGVLSPWTMKKLMATFLFAFCLFLPVTAQDPPQERTESSEKVKLQWKFAEGETTYYTHEEEATIKSSVAGKVDEAVERSFFKYKWTVVFEIDPQFSGIGVSFDRVRQEIVTRDQAITSDTYSPRSPISLSPSEKALQEEVYRTLQTHFVFLATPSGGAAWPEQFFTNKTVPNQFKTPKKSDFFLPEKFTTGDSISLPDQNVKPGDEWTTEIRKTRNFAGGLGHYRVIGRTTCLGQDCWQIEGTTTYKVTASQLTEGITKLKLGPRKSMHFFDAEIGRLVLSEETTPVSVTYRDGRTVETIVRVKRQLAPPTTESDMSEVRRDLADGTTEKFVFRGGIPVNAQNDWLKVIHSGLMLKGEQTIDNQVNVSSLEWSLGLDLSGRKTKSIRLFDVTQDAVTPIDYHSLEIDSESNKAFLLWGASDISATQPEWFHNDVASERIIKVVVENEAGEIKTLYQLILVQTASLRSSDGVVLPK